MPVDSRPVLAQRFPGAWQRGAAAVVVAVWVLIALARLTLLFEKPPAATGDMVQPFLAFARALIPPDEPYLYVDPAHYGADPGMAPRLRFELLPRQFENLPGNVREEEARDFLAKYPRKFIVVPVANAFARDHWIRGSRPWFERISLDRTRYILVVRTTS